MIKSLISLTTSIGVGQVVQNIVTSTTPEDISKFRKVTSAIGGMAVSAILSNLATEYVEEQFDNFGDVVEAVKEKRQKSE